MPAPHSQHTETARTATKKFRVRFEPAGKTVEVNMADLPYNNDGEPGSLLDIAMQNDIDIEHACGGFCSCSTCHVIIRKGDKSCNEESDQEMDMLDNAPGLTPNSRLACQCIPNGTADLVVEIPTWNRNRAKENH
jgi:2Fe-2S ferredoxin